MKVSGSFDKDLEIKRIFSNHSSSKCLQKQVCHREELLRLKPAASSCNQVAASI
jgi:hypothetical protein